MAPSALPALAPLPGHRNVHSRTVLDVVVERLLYLAYMYRSATTKIGSKSFGIIPPRKIPGTTIRFMTNHPPARVFSLEPMGMPAPMRKTDSPGVILMTTFVTTFVMTNSTVFD